MSNEESQEFIDKLLAKYPNAFDLPNTKTYSRIAKVLNVPEDEFKNMSADEFDKYVESKNIPDRYWYKHELPKWFASRHTPDWMISLNRLQNDYPHYSYTDDDALKYGIARKYAEGLLEGDPVDLEHWDAEALERKNQDVKAHEDYEKTSAQMKKENEERNRIITAMGGNKEIIKRIRNNLDYIPSNVTAQQMLQSPYADYAIEDMLNEYYDNEAAKRGIKYPQLKYGPNDYLEDYLVDDYGSKIEDAFDNNMAWFKNKVDIPDNSDLEYQLEKVLKKNRQDLNQRNILRALAPDEDGGLY